MRVQQHSAKPAARFFGKGDYYLGLELEVEAPDRALYNKGLNISKRPSYCYAKHDGSLDEYGWELVTHPIAKSLWMKRGGRNAATSFFRLVSGLRSLGYTSHESGRCGLHIHVCLKAFRGVQPQAIARIGGVMRNTTLKRSHLYWFMRLVNSDLFCKLSQRSDDLLSRWAQIQPVNARSFCAMASQSGSGRYVATNLTANTCEVRVFRGNVREDRIRKCIESVVAAVEFSRGLGIQHFKDNAEEPINLSYSFLEWIENRKTSYPNLSSFISEIGLITTKPKKEEVLS